MYVPNPDSCMHGHEYVFFYNQTLYDRSVFGQNTEDVSLQHREYPHCLTYKAVHANKEKAHTYILSGKHIISHHCFTIITEHIFHLL